MREIPIGQQQEVLVTAERYRGKSGAQVILISTPGAPGGLMQTIEQDPNSIYFKIRLDWKYGKNTIYENLDLQKAMASNSWNREYNLQYLGNVGNIFNTSDLDFITSEANGLKPQLHATGFMGVDIGFGSSDTSLVVSRYEEGLIKVVHAESIHKGVFEDIIDRIIQVQNKHGCVKIFVDGSAVHTVRSLARRLGQIDDFTNIPEEYINTWTTTRKDIKVVPISFAKKHREMLRTLMLCVSKRTLRIHPDFKDLIIGMRSGVAEDDN